MKLLKEQDIRAFYRCPRYFSLGGVCDFSPQLEKLKWLYERFISGWILSEKKDFDLLQKEAYLEFKKHFLLKDLNPETTKTFTLMSDLIRLLPWHLYRPVSLPNKFYINISNINIELEFSSLQTNFETRENYIVTFSPYRNKNDVLNDKINLAKLFFVKDFPYLSSKVLILVVFLNTQNNLEVIKIPSQISLEKEFELFKNTINQIGKTSDPIIPCELSCPFKKECFPEIKYESIKII